MKKREIEKIFKNQISSALPDFNFKGNLIFHKDITEILKGFYFESSSFDPDIFAINSFIQPLYILEDNINLSFGRRLKDEIHGEWISIRNENVNDTISELIEEENEKFLNKVQNANHYYEEIRKDLSSLRMIESFAYTSCYLRHPNAIKDLDFLIYKAKKNDQSKPWIKQILQNAENLKDSYIKTPEEVEKLFFEWRKKTKINLKLI